MPDAWMDARDVARGDADRRARLCVASALRACVVLASVSPGVSMKIRNRVLASVSSGVSESLTEAYE